MIDQFKTRAQILVAFIFIWGSVAAIRLFYYTVHARDRYVEAGEKLAWDEGRIPAKRGDVLDKDGLKLAWTETYFDLELHQDSISNKNRSNLIVILNPLEIKIPSDSLNELVVLRKNLTPSQILVLKDYLGKFPGLHIRPRFERRRIDYPQVRSFIGETISENGRERGISGYEKANDRLLRGEKGLYQVMLDPQGDWIPGSWVLKKKQVPGKALRLPFKLSEILSGEAFNDGSSKRSSHSEKR